MTNCYLGEIVVVRNGHGEAFKVDNEVMLRVIALLKQAGAHAVVGGGGTDFYLEDITVGIEGVYLD